MSGDILLSTPETGITIAGEGLKEFGLDPTSRAEAEATLKNHLRSKGLIGMPTWCRRKLNDYDIMGYSPILSLLLNRYGKHFAETTIVEVGPDIIGLGLLSYLSFKKAKVIAVDPNPSLSITADNLSVKFISGRWEHLDRLLLASGVGSIDVILANYVDERLGRQFDFRSQVIQATDAALKSGGILINGFDPNTDFIIHADDLSELGFDSQTFVLNDSWRIRLFQKP